MESDRRWSKISSKDVLSAVVPKILETCDPMNVMAHPLMTYTRLLLYSTYFPQLTKDLENTKNLLNTMNDRKSQTQAVMELCVKVSSMIASEVNGMVVDREKFASLVIPFEEPTTFNFELVINKANEIRSRVEEAFKKKKIDEAMVEFELAVIETRSLLKRIKGSSIYDEIKRETGIDENNIYDVLKTDDWSEARRKITEVIDFITMYISTHFK